MARKHGKKSGSVKCMRDRGRAPIVGIPRGGHAPRAVSRDSITGAYASGMAMIVYPRDSAKARADFRRFCRANSIMADGIGEPDRVGASGDIFLAYRAVGPVDAIARLVGMPFLYPDAHFDAPATVAGGRAYSVGADGVDQRRLPPVPREARRVVRPDDWTGRGRRVADAMIDMPMPLPDETAAPMLDRMITRMPGRTKMPRSRRGEYPANPTVGFTPSHLVPSHLVPSHLVPSQQ